MAGFKELLKDVLADITPDETERAREKRILSEIESKLVPIIKEKKPGVDAIMVGSIAKGTDLSGDKDFDYFLQFPKKTPRGELEELGLAIAKSFFEQTGSKYQISYAEHPYIKGKYKDFTLEIVPCYKIEEGECIISAVDRSPLHSKFVISKLKRDSALRGEIRLLKKFLKANNVYGAHAAVEGFSGYLCELLVIKYGSFAKVLENASSWGKGEILAIGRKPAKRSLPKNVIEAPLIFIDPVDPKRNVSAAVSVECLAKFIFLANSFIADPNKAFFVEKKAEPLSQKAYYRRLHKRGTHLVAISFGCPDLVEDTLVPQLIKSLKSVASECERKGFQILKKDYWTDGTHVVFLLEFSVWDLPRATVRQGPFYYSDISDLRGFIGANATRAISEPYIRGEHWVMDVEREYRHVEDFLTDYLKEPIGFGKSLREVNSFKVRINSQIKDIGSADFWRFMGSFW